MEAVVIFLGAMAVVLLVRVPRVMAPLHYFEIAEIIHGMNAVTWQGVFIRFSVPVCVAAIATLVFRDNQAYVGAGIGFLSSLLLIWPAFLDRRLLPWQAHGRETALFMLYGMFLASFTVLGLGTGYVAAYLEEPVEAAFSGEGAKAVGGALRDELGNIIVGLALLIVGAVSGAVWRRFDKQANPGRTETYHDGQ